MVIQHHLHHSSSSSLRKARRSRQRTWLPQLSSIANLLLMRCARSIACSPPHLFMPLVFVCTIFYYSYPCNPPPPTPSSKTPRCVFCSESFQSPWKICKEDFGGKHCPSRREIRMMIIRATYWSIVALKPLQWHGGGQGGWKESIFEGWLSTWCWHGRSLILLRPL